MTTRQSATWPLAPQKPNHESRCCPKNHVDTHPDTCRNASSPGSLPPWARRGPRSLGICWLRVLLHAWLWFTIMAFPSPSLKVRQGLPVGHTHVSSGTCSFGVSSGTLSSLRAEHLLLRLNKTATWMSHHSPAWVTEVPGGAFRMIAGKVCSGQR